MCIQGSFHFKFSKPDTSDKKVHSNTKKTKNCTYISKKIYKTSENSKYESNSQKIYLSMARMFKNAESTRNNYGDSSQLISCILDSGATFHMTPEISYH